jgi:THO complex subunit 1
MFQSFPLGDKSSVNLRGEFHTENVTNFDEVAKKPEGDAMEVEPAGPGTQTTETESQTTQAPENEGGEASKEKKADSTPAPDVKEDKKIDLDALYPIFWSLQGFFSSPTRLFDSQNFSTFRSGLKTTLKTFKLLNADINTRGSTKAPEELRRGLKRKRNGDGVEISNSFNPKYLTSRELFGLEVILLTN